MEKTLAVLKILILFNFIIYAFQVVKASRETNADRKVFIQIKNAVFTLAAYAVIEIISVIYDKF